MSGQLERPPTSGPGSGAAAWRAYAAALTGSPAEAWAELSRDEVIAQLESDGVVAAAPEDGGPSAGAAPAATGAPEESGRKDGVAPVVEGPAGARRPLWMVPTDDGMVPEVELRARQRQR
ncbi:hypothetical protein [Amycolatopsis thermoflava]|uniref:hypothetical protein n=1 Tax=Amycolatopsis thermoflava TaxID=84480 RepID=UPI0003F978FA|nr:hypothetical protein [Amycolatopsis thermoflava]